MLLATTQRLSQAGRRGSAGHSQQRTTCRSSMSSNRRVHSKTNNSRRLAVRVSATAASQGQDLRQLLAQKERQLSSLFESGQPMPQASVVAALRAEIAALDDQLNGRPVSTPMFTPGAGGGGGGPPVGNNGYVSRGAGAWGGGGPAPMRPPSSTSSSYSPAAAPAGAPAGAVRSRTEQLADKAYEMVEQQMRGGGAGGGNQPMSQGMSRAMAGGSHMGQGGHLGQQDDNEIARLEHENTQLRAEAYALLQRQQQLEAMLAEVNGQKEPELLLESAESLLARMKAKLQKSV